MTKPREIEIPRLLPDGGLTSYPPPDRWDDWEEYDATAWPKRVSRHYRLIPTTCFNCESACGLLAYVDKESGEIRRFEGNPAHPGSRGRNCAKGPATINQVYDPERILYPMKRRGPRGSGDWERVTWEEALSDIGGRMNKAIREGRHDEIMYHVGRPGEDGFMDRTLKAWGVDGHNSHTNICSSGARVGYAMWSGYDRPSADFANAEFILLLSAHLETGHYFNPHAQRITEARRAGARLATIDPRLSNTAAMSDYWLSTWPGTEAALFLAFARLLLEWDAVDHEFVRRWVNWEDSLAGRFPDRPVTYEAYIAALKETYDPYTPEWVAEECGIEPDQVVAVAREIADAGHRFASHTWRATGSGNLGGWQAARTLWFLHVLTGSVGTEGGTSPSGWDKFSPKHWNMPPPHSRWNELLWPIEYPLAHHEMSILLPHLINQGRGKLDVYFTRVYNPIWTNPDGFSWLEMLTDEDKVGLHVALTPTWSESAWYADYVLPMGVAAERHDTHSYETHAARWLGFRQPVLRVAGEREGKTFDRTYEANPGEVWEETEFWIDLSWHVDPDGSLGIRKWFESPDDPSRPVSVDEYYGWMFEHSVPGLPEAAAAEGLNPLEYMRKYGAFEVERDIYGVHERPASTAEEGVMVEGVPMTGFKSPSKKLEWYSRTMDEWGWKEEAIPTYLRSHVNWRDLDLSGDERILLPIFRLPTLIHTRSGNAKYLYEISHGHPLWINPSDADALGFETGQMVRLTTDIGWFVMRAWRTEGIRPGVVAASHHLGRWRLDDEKGNERWSSALVDIERLDDGRWRLRQKKGIEPFESDDPDSSRIWWRDPGVNQNLAFPVHPDPVSGQHAWHQRVRLSSAGPEDRYGDVVVDTARSTAVFEEWLTKTKPGPGPDGMRRPLWLARPVKPTRMPTASERAATEAERWRDIASRWSPEQLPFLYRDVAPDEHSVVVFSDPDEDLARRTSDWGFVIRRPHIDELARFASSLAVSESEAWAADVPDLAMRAYESRRLLLGDRIAHWAVPWLEAVGSWFPEIHDGARGDRDTLLEIADEMRIAPSLSGSEGLVLPGEDAFGPVTADVPLHRFLRSVWSGEVILNEALPQALAPETIREPPLRRWLREQYEQAADRWRAIAGFHPGSAQLWLDLAARADRTTALLG